MGLYEVPLSVSLLGFGIGTMLANFHLNMPSKSALKFTVSYSSFISVIFTSLVSLHLL